MNDYKFNSALDYNLSTNILFYFQEDYKNERKSYTGLFRRT